VSQRGEAWGWRWARWKSCGGCRRRKRFPHRAWARARDGRTAVRPYGTAVAGRGGPALQLGRRASFDKLRNNCVRQRRPTYPPYPPSLTSSELWRASQPAGRRGARAGGESPSSARGRLRRPPTPAQHAIGTAGFGDPALQGGRRSGALLRSPEATEAGRSAPLGRRGGFTGVGGLWYSRARSGRLGPAEGDRLKGRRPGFAIRRRQGYGGQAATAGKGGPAEGDRLRGRRLAPAQR